MEYQFERYHDNKQLAIVIGCDECNGSADCHCGLIGCKKRLIPAIYDALPLLPPEEEEEEEIGLPVNDAEGMTYAS